MEEINLGKKLEENSSFIILTILALVVAFFLLKIL